MGILIAWQHIHWNMALAAVWLQAALYVFPAALLPHQTVISCVAATLAQSHLCVSAETAVQFQGSGSCPRI